MKPCSIDGCTSVGRVVKGMCNAHYLKVRKYGDPRFVARPPAPEGMKVCCACKELLTTASFNKLTAAKDGLYPSCRDCTNANKRQSWAASSEENRARRRAEYAADLRGRRTEQSRKAREAWAARETDLDLRTYRDRHLRRKFGISVDEYDRMHDAQNGLCAVCNEPETDADYRTKRLRFLAVDHCHDSGAVRGLLCRRCNTALGLLLESPDRVEALLAYLRR